VGAIKDVKQKSNYVLTSACLSVTQTPPSVLKLHSSNLAIKFLIIMAKGLPTRFLNYSLGPELYESFFFPGLGYRLCTQAILSYMKKEMYLYLDLNL